MVGGVAGSGGGGQILYQCAVLIIYKSERADCIRRKE